MLCSVYKYSKYIQYVLDNLNWNSKQNIEMAKRMNILLINSIYRAQKYVYDNNLYRFID